LRELHTPNSLKAEYGRLHRRTVKYRRLIRCREFGRIINFFLCYSKYLNKGYIQFSDIYL